MYRYDPGFGVYSTLYDVEFAKINADGTLSNWTETLSLSAVAGQNVSWVSNGYLWVMGNGLTERSYINSDGTLAGWQVINSPFPTQPQNITYAYDGNLYGMFGNGTVMRVRPHVTGTFGEVETIEPLPNGSGQTMVAAKNYVYVLGSGSNYTEVYYRPADGILCDLFFNTALDTAQLIFENAPGLTSQPTVSWLSTYNGATGVLKIQFTQANQGVKMTLVSSEWFSSVSTDWYEMKAQVCSDDTTYPNDLFAVGVLFNGANTSPMDITGHGLYSLSSGWSYLYDFQQSYGGTSMYPQLTFKNNDTYPVTIYLESVGVKPISPPGN